MAISFGWEFSHRFLHGSGKTKNLYRKIHKAKGLITGREMLMYKGTNYGKRKNT